MDLMRKKIKNNDNTEFGLVNYMVWVIILDFNLAPTDTMLQIFTFGPVKEVMPYLIVVPKKTLRWDKQVEN
jgi:hypothetical protein